MEQLVDYVNSHPGEAAVTVSISALAVLALAAVAIAWLRVRPPPG